MNLPLPASPTDVGISVDFLRQRAPFLARDLAMQLAPGEDLAAAYGLTAPQWAVLATSSVFLDLVSKSREELAGPEGVAEKIRRKAAVIVDTCGLIDMAAIMSDPKAAYGTRIDAFSQIASLAGLNKNTSQTGLAGVTGALIQINVNTDGQSKTVNIGEIAPPLEPAQ